MSKPIEPRRYLILDRCDRDPQWVVAEAKHARPARVPGDLDRMDGLAPGTRWLGEFGPHDFSWLRWLFGRLIGLVVTPPGQECLATRLGDHGRSRWIGPSTHSHRAEAGPEPVDPDEHWITDSADGAPGRSAADRLGRIHLCRDHNCGKHRDGNGPG